MRACKRSGWLFLGVALGALQVWQWPRAVGAQPGDSHWFSESAANEAAVLGALRPVLRATGKVARVYFSAYCPPGENDPVVFPKLETLAPSQGATGLMAVREIFRDAKNVSSVEEPAGVIRVSIGVVPKSLLATPIATLKLNADAQYTDLLAVQSVLGAPEVRSAMGRLQIRVSNKPIITGVNPVDERYPHMPVRMLNVTMDQALDEVARTFKTIVTYGACVNSNLIEVRETGEL